MRTLGRLARYAWAGPNTCLGVLAGLLSLMRPRARDGVLVFEGRPRGFLWALTRMKRRAITLGHAVVTADPFEGRLRRHELVHVRQYERLGPAYIPAYLAVWAVRGYRRHPFELAAMRAELGEPGEPPRPGGPP